MRIQTRLFLGTAALVLSLVAVQWWLHARQLGAMERETAAVATSVGKDLLTAVPTFFQVAPAGGGSTWEWTAGGDTGAAGEKTHDVQVMVVPQDAHGVVTRRIEQHVTQGDEKKPTTLEWTMKTEVTADALECLTGSDPSAGVAPTSEGGPRHITLEVVGGTTRTERFLLVGSDAGHLRRIPIPVAGAVASFRSSLREGVAISGVLLAVGLVGAGVLSNRLTRPLRRLAAGADALGRGELGIEVPETAGGEVGELQRAFNSMSMRLAALEKERERWRQREHLAQLGDLSRGLAHTLRNPLNTLGLAVEELAAAGGEGEQLAVTARAQIRRIDRWLRSFLALGASGAAEPRREDLADLVRAVVFEAVQQGAHIDLESPDDEVPVSVVGTAIQAALSNLVENAVQVSPVGEAVTVKVERIGGEARVEVHDRGPGLPEAVRVRLFSPHVTTRPEGSGMGLFLAHHLVAGMNDGALELGDAAGGGTVARVRLPLEDGRDE